MAIGIQMANYNVGAAAPSAGNYLTIPIGTPIQKNSLEHKLESSGLFSKLGYKIRNKYLAGILAGSLALSGMAFSQQKPNYNAKQNTSQSEQYATTQPTAVFPQFADGGGYRTRIVITYPSKDANDKPESITLHFLGGASGEDMPVTMKDSNLRASSFNYTINPKSRLEVETSGFGTTANSGYVVIESNSATSKLVPSILYFTPNNSVVSSSKSKQLAEQFFDAKKTLDEITAAAFVNADTTKAANTTLYLTDENGKEVDRKTMTLAPGGYLARTLEQLFPILSKNNNFKGTVSAVGDPIYTIALGFNNFDNLWTVASGEGAIYSPVVAPKDVDVNIKIADVVTLAPMNGVTSTVNIGSAQYQTSTGTLNIKLKPGNYSINANNSSIFPEWKILRYSANCDGANSDKMDIAKTTPMTFTVPDNINSLDGCVIGIPNDWVGTRNLDGKLMDKAYFQSVFSADGFVTQFADPKNIIVRYQNLTTDPDVITKANVKSVIDYINTRARRHRLIFQDGGPFPASNYMQVEVTNQGPSNGGFFNNSILSHSFVDLKSDSKGLGGWVWDVVFEEMFEAMYHIGDTPFRSSLLVQNNVLKPAELSRVGNVFFYFNDESSAKTKVK